MIDQIRQRAFSLLDLLQGVWTTISIILALTAVVLIQVRSDASRDSRLTSLERNYDLLNKRVEDIDKLGSRMLNERISHLTDILGNVDTRTTAVDDSIQRRIDLISSRLNEVEQASTKSRELSGVVNERQQNVIRRLDAVEKVTDKANQIDVLKNDIARLGEQQMRIIQALDNTYNTLQEALRGGGITRKPTPGSNQSPY